MSNPQAPLLKVQGLRVHYGGIEAVKGIDLYVNTGELVTLIGCNGAGKSSTLKAIAGLISTPADTVQYNGVAVGTRPAYERQGLGMAFVPEGRGVFTRMTILENLMMGAFHRGKDPSIEEDLHAMFALFPRLKERQHQLAGTLSGGEQQMLAMTRALMSQPKLLVLDEPSMGLSPIMVEKVFELIKQVSHTGTTILLVEQNANLALQIADRGYVMDSGTLMLQGPAAELLDDPKVREAYLGEDSASASDVNASA